MDTETKTGKGFQEFKVKGSHLVEKVREIIEAGNTRRIIIKREDRVVFEIPLSWGVGGAVAALWMAPVLAAIGAMAALVSDFTVVIEPREPGDNEPIDPGENLITPDVDTPPGHGPNDPRA